MHTLQVGPSRKLHFLELTKYDLTSQPRIYLRPYREDGPGVSITLEIPSIDLRSYDADYNFKRLHAIFRCDGVYASAYRLLSQSLVIAPACNEVLTDSEKGILARVCHVNTDYCVTTPHSD